MALCTRGYLSFNFMRPYPSAVTYPGHTQQSLLERMRRSRMVLMVFAFTGGLLQRGTRFLSIEEAGDSSADPSRYARCEYASRRTGGRGFVSSHPSANSGRGYRERRPRLAGTG